MKATHPRLGQGGTSDAPHTLQPLCGGDVITRTQHLVPNAPEKPTPKPPPRPQHHLRCSPPSLPSLLRLMAAVLLLHLQT